MAFGGGGAPLIRFEVWQLVFLGRENLRRKGLRPDLSLKKRHLFYVYCVLNTPKKLMDDVTSFEEMSSHDFPRQVLSNL